MDIQKLFQDFIALGSREIGGQVIGLVAMAMFFVSYQIRKKNVMLSVQAVATGLFVLHYFLLGAITAMALNTVGVLRNLFYIFRDSKYGRNKRFLQGPLFPVLFAVAITALGVLSWNGWHSLLVMAGLAINTVCLGVLNSQNIRKSILITCPMVLIYNIIEVSVGGILNESISMVSGIIGIVRYAKENRVAENA